MNFDEMSNYFMFNNDYKNKDDNILLICYKIIDLFNLF